VPTSRPTPLVRGDQPPDASRVSPHRSQREEARRCPDPTAVSCRYVTTNQGATPPDTQGSSIEQGVAPRAAGAQRRRRLSAARGVAHQRISGRVDGPGGESVTRPRPGLRRGFRGRYGVTGGGQPPPPPESVSSERQSLFRQGSRASPSRRLRGSIRRSHGPETTPGRRTSASSWRTGVGSDRPSTWHRPAAMSGRVCDTRSTHRRRADPATRNAPTDAAASLPRDPTFGPSSTSNQREYFPGSVGSARHRVQRVC
jgi:hypothetical protein